MNMINYLIYFLIDACLLRPYLLNIIDFLIGLLRLHLLNIMTMFTQHTYAW